MFSSPALANTPTVINTPGGDDSSYQIPLSGPVMFFGQQYSSIWATTNAVITFGRPDGTFWDFPMTPSISLGSQDWEAYAGRAGEQFVISYTDNAFQVDMIARPFGSGTGVATSRLVLTGIINQDRTINFSYYLENTDRYPNLRFGVRTPSGQILSLEQANFQESSAPPPSGGEIMQPEPTQSPTVSPEITESSTVSPEPTESPTVSPEETESSTLSEEVSESPTASSEVTESETVSPEPEVSESSTVSEETESPVVPSDPGRVELLVNEGDFLGYVAPEGYRIARVESASYGADNGCHAENSLTIVQSFVTETSLSISADNSVFGDPCGGIYKRLSIVLIIEQIQPVDPTSSSSTVSESAQTESPTQSPQPEPSPSAEPSPEPTQPSNPTPSPTETSTPTPTPLPEASPQPEPEPSPTPEPSPEPLPEPVTPTPTPEPGPSPTTDPSPVPTVQPTPEPTKPIQPSATPSPAPKPEPTPSVVPQPVPTPVTPQPVPSPAPSPSITPSPVPIVPERPGPVEIKAPITSENIAAVVQELATVQPQLLTQEQQTLIKEAALETFNTAKQGSPEYRAALDALLIVAQADDIVLDEELAAIPLIGNVAGAAVEVFNALGNAGADMSPQVREQSEKVVIASVIVANIAITATAAATSAAAVAARRP